MTKNKKMIFRTLSVILRLVAVVALLIGPFPTSLTKPTEVLAVSSTGGTITQIGEDVVHTFTSSGTFTLTGGPLTVQYTVVAGGGASGASGGGGGGGGGMLDGSASLNGSYTITVGNGGSNNLNGGDSSISGVATATGGGHGDGGSGGSGGGGFLDRGPAGSGTAGQGNSGEGGYLHTAGGGGGAGGAGGVPTCAMGGSGKASSVNGVTYAGGGGGGNDGAGYGSCNPAGGSGGGGSSWGSGGNAGTPNTGGGGGGAPTSLSGGSGIVILRYHSLNAPTIGTPVASPAAPSTSIRWTFTDTSSLENGFKVYDGSGNLMATCVGANLTYCDETGLSPNTSYTRKVAAYSNTLGVGQFSNTASFTTASITPLAPTVNTPTTSTLNVNPNPGANAPSSDVYAIFKQTAAGACGTNGTYLAANGSDNGATPVWQTDSAWSTVTATGLSLDGNTYSICVADKNTAGTITLFGPSDSSNGGYCALSGCSIITGSPSITKYTDGNNGGRNVYGVDNGSGTGVNTAAFNLASGPPVVVNSVDTLVVGKLTLTGGSITIATGGQITIGSKLWVVDQDNDGIPAATSIFESRNQPTAKVRRTAIPTMAVSPDCNDGNANVWAPHAVCYTDGDSDTYTTTQNANTTCLGAVGITAPTCAQATKAGLAGNGNSAATFTAGQLRDAANGNDCNDANNTIFRSVNGYLDADGDGYGVGTLQTCVGAAGNYTASQGGDCYDANANAHPGSAYCGTIGRDGTTTPGTNNYDYDCGGTNVACGTAYDRSCGGQDIANVCTACAYNGNCSLATSAWSNQGQTCGQTTHCPCTGWFNACGVASGGNPYCTSRGSAGTQGCQ